jgi:acetylornithine deacetylase/succinyl-diaminopimelate desuccinylase-like protein
LIENVIYERDHGSRVLPWVLTGFSDAKWLERLGVTVYGFSPVKLPPGVRTSTLAHGHDERIPLAGFVWGMDTFWTTVSRFVEDAAN